MEKGIDGNLFVSNICLNLPVNFHQWALKVHPPNSFIFTLLLNQTNELVLVLYCLVLSFFVFNIFVRADYRLLLTRLTRLFPVSSLVVAAHLIQLNLSALKPSAAHNQVIG